MLLCSINNKITRAARFLARRRRCAAHGKLRSLCTKKKARPSSPLSKPAPNARLICEASPVFDAPLLVKWPKIERCSGKFFSFHKNALCHSTHTHTVVG